MFDYMKRPNFIIMLVVLGIVSFFLKPLIQGGVIFWSWFGFCFFAGVALAVYNQGKIDDAKKKTKDGGDTT